MLRKVWNAVKPKDFKHVIMYLVVVSILVILWPDIQNAYTNQGHLTQSQIIDTEMTKRWMLLPQDQTKAGTLIGPSGTKFIFRVYPDDSLLVSDGKRLKWLPSEAALAEIESKRPSHRWIIDLVPFLGSIRFVDIAYAGEQYCKESIKKQVGPTTFIWRIYCPPTYLAQVCTLNTKTGRLVCVIVPKKEKITKITEK